MDDDLPRHLQTLVTEVHERVERQLRRDAQALATGLRRPALALERLVDDLHCDDALDDRRLRHARDDLDALFGQLDALQDLASVSALHFDRLRAVAVDLRSDISAPSR